MRLEENFMIGCNYWDSKSGTDMWRKFDADVIRNDFVNFKKTGGKYLRVFPNWRDFQPLYTLRKWGGTFAEYAFEDDTYPDNPYGIDTKQLENFRTMCDIAEECGIKLHVAVVTGWMSGRQFYPPAIENLPLMTHPTSLRFTERFITGFVNALKDHKAIVAWGLGNECNCMQGNMTRDESFLWTSLVANTIRKCDPTRPVYSGMHGLKANPTEAWNAYDIGELTDMMTPHGYPGSPTIAAYFEPSTKLRTSLSPTIYHEYYTGMGGKPSIFEETGGFTENNHNLNMQGEHVRVSMYSALANGAKGYLWWCAEEHIHLKTPPYTWCLMERSLGMLDRQQNLKPQGEAMKHVVGVLESLPFDELPDKETDTVIVLTPGDEWKQAVSSYILARQAGLSPVIRTTYQKLPDAKLYIVTRLDGWSPVNVACFESLLEKAENGATVLMTSSTGALVEPERILGLRSNGMCVDSAPKKANLTLCGEQVEIPFSYARKFMYESVGAEVLGTDAEGNIVFSKNAYGKGFIYFLNFPLETMIHDRPFVFSYENKIPYYHIYKEAGAEVLKEKDIISNNNQILTTVHPYGDKKIIVAINYSDIPQKCDFTLADGKKLEVIYGSDKEIGPDDAAFYYLY